MVKYDSGFVVRAKDSMLSEKALHRLQPNSGKQVRIRKRDRITYSQQQLDLLEIVFRQTKYPDYDVRLELERQSKLSQRRIQVWFKNRRVRFRQEEGPVEPCANVQRKPRGSSSSEGSRVSPYDQSTSQTATAWMNTTDSPTEQCLVVNTPPMANGNCRIPTDKCSDACQQPIAYQPLFETDHTHMHTGMSFDDISLLDINVHEQTNTNHAELPSDLSQQDDFLEFLTSESSISGVSLYVFDS